MTNPRKVTAFFAATVVAHAMLVGCDDKKQEDQGQKEPEQHAEEVRLTQTQIELAEIKTVPAAMGRINILMRATGEVAFDQDRIAHVLARASGFVHEVRAGIGDAVRTGDVMAIVESRELSEVKAGYLAARQRAALAQEKFAREERLWRQKVSAEQEYLESRQALAEAQIELRSAEQALRSLGFNAEYVADLSRGSGVTSTQYELTAPIDGTVIERHIVRGQKVDSESKAFIVADLRRVWVIASVYERDIGRVRPGQKAFVRVRGASDQPFVGVVARVGGAIDERSRTLKVRIELDSPEQALKPGMFARVDLAVGSKDGILVVPVSAVLTQQDESYVFVDEGEGRFARREIKTGLQAEETVEVIEGLSPDEKVVAQGAATLKAELNKEGLGGHAH